MKAALHRSITFWSGLLVMGFVCWAWWDSTSHSSCVLKGGLMVSNERGGILSDYFALRTSPRFRFYRDPTEPVGIILETFPRPHLLLRASLIEAELDELYTRDDEERPFTREEYLRYRLALAEKGDWLLFIPHWLILLTVAAVWLLLLFMRARRRNKSVITQ